MKTPGIVVKGITLTVFLLLVGAFVVFKTGALREEEPTEESYMLNPNANNLADNNTALSEVDTPIISLPDSSYLWIPSSKSGPIFKGSDFPEEEEDSLPLKIDTTSTIKPKIGLVIPIRDKQSFYHLSSSKSVVSFQPKDIFYIKRLSVFAKHGLPEPSAPIKPYIMNTVSYQSPR